MPSGKDFRTGADSIRDATAQAMRENESVLVLGLGVNDPGRVFGTTQGLVEEFGAERVFETPTAENAMMGVAVGAAVGGFRPILTHQRADFFYLALDQLVNSAAKWRFMFGAQFSVPIVVRLIVGRGWGQGPTHSQNLATWISHVPGLKVVYPSNPANASSLLLEAINDDNPTVFIEDRWLHQTSSLLSSGDELHLGKSLSRRNGDDFTLVAYGWMVSEALKAAQQLSEMGIETEVIDIGTLSPIDTSPILSSIARTRHLIALEPGPVQSSFSESLLGKVATCTPKHLPFPHLEVLGAPFIPQPTSYGTSRHHYPTAADVVEKVCDLLGVDYTRKSWNEEAGSHYDVADSAFLGPF